MEKAWPLALPAAVAIDSFKCLSSHFDLQSVSLADQPVLCSPLIITLRHAMDSGICTCLV